MRLRFSAIFSDGFEDFDGIVSTNARRLWYKAYSFLRYISRYRVPENFVHVDFPELGITASRFTIPEDRSIDGKLHRTTVIERTVF